MKITAVSGFWEMEFSFLQLRKLSSRLIETELFIKILSKSPSFAWLHWTTILIDEVVQLKVNSEFIYTQPTNFPVESHNRCDSQLRHVIFHNLQTNFRVEMC